MSIIASGRGGHDPSSETPPVPLENPHSPAAATIPVRSLDSQVSRYLPLLQSADHIFEHRFNELLPPVRNQGISRPGFSPLGKTEAIAYDWLAHGGKRFRPFITLAAYDALTRGATAAAASGNRIPAFSTGVSRVAMAIEAFHKASLVHDDIEDDDLYRYGEETLHRRHGLETAINVGDYLIGLGYRLVSSVREEIGSAAAADILDRMAIAHLKLCDGQGAEMAWNDVGNLQLSPQDALQIYALKTAPAFEAALYAGCRIAGPVAAYEEVIPHFCRHLGVGFQILNDLKDWRGDRNNKMVAGQDALALRPTLLLALALESASSAQRAELNRILECSAADALQVERLRRVFEECHVFDEAASRIEKCRSRALALAAEVEPLPLRQLLYFLVEAVLTPEDDAPPEPAAGLGALPIL